MTLVAKTAIAVAIIFAIFAGAFYRSARTDESESWNEVTYNMLYFFGAVPAALMFVAYVLPSL